MSMTTRAKTVLSGAIASLALLTLVASPTLAVTDNQTVTPTTTSSSTNSSTNEAKLTQQQPSQITAQTNQTPEQPNQAGCACCKSMMNNMRGMMNNMPGMMNNQNSPSK